MQQGHITGPSIIIIVIVVADVCFAAATTSCLPACARGDSHRCWARPALPQTAFKERATVIKHLIPNLTCDPASR